MHVSKNPGLLLAAGGLAGLLSGCISTHRETTVPPAVVQLPLPAVVVQPPARPAPTTMSKSSTTSWDNGAIVQKQSITTTQAREQKHVTTSGTPELVTTTTTTTSPQQSICDQSLETRWKRVARQRPLPLQGLARHPENGTCATGTAIGGRAVEIAVGV